MVDTKHPTDDVRAPEPGTCRHQRDDRDRRDDELGDAKTGPGPAPRILVVDDDPGVLGALCRTLRGEGWIVVSACDGPSALRAFERAPFDLVVSDENMPGLTGTELIARLRALSPTVRLVLMTGMPDARHREELAPLGVRQIVSKPWSRGGLLEALRSAMR